jgi:hypothetical protein
MNVRMWLAAFVVLLAAQASAVAQSPQAAHPDFSGTWALDRNISTDPGQIELVPSENASRRPQRGGGGGIGGFGGRGGRRRTDGGDSAEGLTSIEQERLKALTDQLKTSVGTLVISHHDPDFIVNDAQNHTLFLHTTGVSEENHLGQTTISSSTHWDGSRLVTECVLGSRLTVVYTYTLLADTRQLVVRVARQSGDRQRAGQDVRLVYRPQK